MIATAASDPSQPVQYTFYLSAVSPPGSTQSSGWITSTVWTPDTLNYGTLYSWQVIAQDAYGNLSQAPSISFTTVEAPPGYVTATPEPAATFTHTPAPSATRTSIATPPPPLPPPPEVTITDEPTSTLVPTATATDTPVPSPTATSTPTNTSVPTATGIAIATATSLSPATPMDTALPIATPSPTLTPPPPSVTLTAVPTVTGTPVLAPTAIARVVPTSVRHSTAMATPAGVAARSAPASLPTTSVDQADEGTIQSRSWLTLGLAALAGLAVAAGLRRGRRDGQ